jgi:hypothetical protein
MKSLDDYLKKQKQIDEHKVAAKQKHPKGFEPGISYNPNTNVGSVVSRPTTNPNPTFDSLLREWGWDPKLYEIVGNLHVRTWDMNMGSGIKEQAWYYKADIRKKNPDRDSDLKKLIDEIKKHKPRKKVQTKKGVGFFYFASDWQLGKPDGGGPQATIDRVKLSLDNTVDRLKELKKLGVNVSTIYIISLGDLIEGVEGFYAGQSHQVQLDRIEQVTLCRRLLLEIITTLSKHAPKVIVGGVPGNHGQNRGKDGKVLTTELDNDDIGVLTACADALSFGPYKHVKFVIPDGHHLTLDCNGTVIGFTHGHLSRGGTNPGDKLMNFWKGQSFGMQSLGDATILVSGHYHHLRTIQDGLRTWFQVPSLDKSNYFTERTGTETVNNVVTFTVDKNGWDHFKLV